MISCNHYTSKNNSGTDFIQGEERNHKIRTKLLHKTCYLTSKLLFLNISVVQLNITDLVSTIEEEIYFYWETGLGLFWK